MDARSFRTLLLGWMRIAVSVATGLVTVPLLIERLSDRYYGLWIALQDISNISYFLIGGLGAFWIREMIRTTPLRDGDDVAASSAFRIHFYLGGFVSLIVACCLWGFLQTLKTIGPEQIDPYEMFLVAIVVAANVWRAFCVEPFSAYLRANAKWGVLTLVQVCHLVTRASVLFLALQRGDSLLKLAILVLLVDTVFALVLYRIVCVSNPQLRIDLSIPSFSSMVSAIGFGCNASFLIRYTDLWFYVDTLVIGVVLGPSILSHTSVAQQITLYFVMLSSVFGEILFVHLARMQSQSDVEKSNVILDPNDGDGARKLSRQQAFFRMGQRYSFLLGAVGALVMLISGPFVAVWIGKDAFVTATSELIIPMVTISMILTLFHQLPMSYLLAGKKTNGATGILVIELLVKCVVAVAVTSVWGVRGLLCANLLIVLVFNGAIMGALVAYHLNLPMYRAVTQLLLPCLISSVVIYSMGRVFLAMVGNWEAMGRTAFSGG